ncbi:MAG: protein kinase, partial [Candidatus Aminicenantes bacterium]|nr:protein kinase [Candidatus Aminicenantes bacterium]
ADVCPNCGYSFAEEKTVEIKRIPASMLHEFDPLMEKLGEKYEILGLLGRGGFSTVLLVEDKILRRKCALKVLSSEVAGSSQELMERFKREARMYAELEHPNIVPIYDVGFYGNRAYILMKFIEGKTLKEIISEREHLFL